MLKIKPFVLNFGLKLLHVHDTIPIKGVSVMNFLEIKPNEVRPYIRFTIKTTDPFHSVDVLAYEHRFIWCKAGQAVFSVMGEQISLTKGDVLYISTATPYRCLSSSENCEIYYYYFDLTMQNCNFLKRCRPQPVSAFAEENILCPYRLQYNGQQITWIVEKEAYESAKYLQKILDHAKPKADELQTALLSGYSVLALTHLLESHYNGRVNKTVATLAQNTIAYIQQHYAEPLSVSEISAAMQFSQSYVNRSLQAYTGLPVKKYLLHFRLEKAMELLSTTKLSVQEVAESCGFGDAKNFSTTFKKHYGISPSSISANRLL